MARNHRLVLAARPTGLPSLECWREETVSIPTIQDGQALVAVELLSIDPAMRGWMARDTYAPAIPIGEVMRSIGLGTVIESRSERFPVGAKVVGSLGWQTHAVISKGQAGVVPNEPLNPTWPLSVLGLSGRTAYFGMTDIGQPKEGETVIVSSAAGTVGVIASQIARIYGARVIGIAGGDEKQAYLGNELGLDVALNYKAPDFVQALEDATAGGVDVYFDNVGGALLERLLTRINIGARIVACGAISDYNAIGEAYGVKTLGQLITRRARIQGFLETDYAPRYREAITALREWALAGKIKWREHVVTGIENAPTALISLLKGEIEGKPLIAVEGHSSRR